jgi:hypothetical protein
MDDYPDMDDIPDDDGIVESVLDSSTCVDDTVDTDDYVMVTKDDEASYEIVPFVAPSSFFSTTLARLVTIY